MAVKEDDEALEKAPMVDKNPAENSSHNEDEEQAKTKKSFKDRLKV
jgi:hypothetical protein